MAEGSPQAVAQTEIAASMLKDGLNNYSAGGGIGMGVPSQYDINKETTHQQMYQSFVRGTLTRKRPSQFSERKAVREKNIKHT